MAKIAKLPAGAQITESWLNQLVASVNALQNIAGAAPISVSRDAAGVRVALDVPIPRLTAFELKDSLTAGGSVDARRQRNDGSDAYEDDDELDDEEIFDELYGTLTGSDGDRAVCFFDGMLDKWVILGIACGE